LFGPGTENGLQGYDLRSCSPRAPLQEIPTRLTHGHSAANNASAALQRATPEPAFTARPNHVVRCSRSGLSWSERAASVGALTSDPRPTGGRPARPGGKRERSAWPQSGTLHRSRGQSVPGRASVGYPVRGLSRSVALASAGAHTGHPWPTGNRPRAQEARRGALGRARNTPRDASIQQLIIFHPLRIAVRMRHYCCPIFPVPIALTRARMVLQHRSPGQRHSFPQTFC
jgi:hypothetical protein